LKVETTGIRRRSCDRPFHAAGWVGQITASGDIGPHQSFIVPHRTTHVAKTLKKD